MTTTPDSPPSGIVLLSPRTFLLAEGADRVRFLNGQLTNDVRATDDGVCVYSAILNAKGQLDAVCHVRAVGETLLLDAPKGLAETLRDRLDRYLISEDVTLTDVSDRWHLAHDFGDLSGVPEDGDTVIHEVNRFGAPGKDILSPEPLDLALGNWLSFAQVDAYRIAQGVPLWPDELHPGLLAPEAGLDRDAISYDKGCYLGQEVISRMKRAGKTNRHLVQMEVPLGTRPGPLHADGAEAGVVTSISPAVQGGVALALGYRKRKFEGRDNFDLSEGAGSARILKRLT